MEHSLKSHWKTSWWILLLLGTQMKTESVPNLCPESPVCECKRIVDMININCYGIDSLWDVQALVQKDFQNATINNLYLQNCSIEHIPDMAFQNATILTIFFKCPLRNISDEAFEGINGLRQIKLYYTSDIQVPKAISATESVQGLWLQYGALKNLAGEIKNLTNLLLLSLSNNAINNVAKNAFSTLVNLQRLDLSYNNITILDPSIFDSLINVQFIFLAQNELLSIDGLLKNLNPSVIDIHGNNLTSVEGSFHQDMWKVTELDLALNPLNFISPEAFAGCLTHLEILDLHKIYLTNPDPDIFQSFPRLSQLDLSNNKIINVSSNIFHNLVALLLLRLDYNNIVSIEGLFRSVPHITELYLSYNFIEVLGSSLQSMQKLQILDLKYNKIRYILKSDFSNLHDLQRLDLTYNKIQWLSPRSFSDFPSLKMLILTSNNITSINGSVQYLPNLEGMFLSYNRIRVINSSELVGLPNLQNFSLYSNEIDTLNGAFVSLPKLISILLAKNKLVSLSKDTFFDVSRLRQISLDRGNEWSCDCRLLWLLDWLSSVNFTVLDDVPRCHLPVRLWGRAFMNLTDQDLIEWPDRCPDPCRCVCTPQGRNFYVSVDCSNKELKVVPEFFPDHIGELNLQRNLLRNVDVLANESVNSIVTLNLEENLLDSFPVVFPESLQVLLLAGNNLTRFSNAAVGNLSLVQVTLSKNPWICNCGTLAFKRWLLSEGTVVSDVNTTLCGPNQANDALSNKVIAYLTDTELCPPKISLYISVAVGLLGIMLAITSLGLAYTRNKIKIKVWMYAHGFTFVKEEDLDKDKEFDAFVSYSSYDTDFCIAFKEELKRREPQMSLCSDENFMYGTLIINNITNAVKSSKRTILILSENFLKSEWCKTEFRAAHQQALEDKIHRLIIVRYGELPTSCEVDPALQEYLDTTTYLKWGEKYFWDKLFYALPKKKKRRERDTVSINSSERTPLLTS